MGCNLQKLELCIRRGATVDIPIRVESDVLVYAPISDITQGAPATITAALHGALDGWRGAVAGVKGMTEINASRIPPKETEFRRMTVADTNTVSFNTLITADFRPYQSGGYLVYYLPLDLSVFNDARMEVKDKVGGTQLAFFSVTGGELEIDQATRSLWLRLPAAEDLDFDSGVFDIELVRTNGDIVPLCSAQSTLTVSPEITTAE